VLEEISRQSESLELQIKEQEDAKVRKSLLSHHKQLIVQQINKIMTVDPSEVNVASLHRLAVSLLFLIEHNSLLYASAKALPVMANACSDEEAKSILASISSLESADEKDKVRLLATRALKLAEPKPKGKTGKAKPKKI
jgi:hypothetical protein